MIAEWIQYLTSEAPDWAKQKGLVYESIALRARHQRNKSAWSPHLKQCQEKIRQFLRQEIQSGPVLVFGSGFLLDFPSDVLTDSRFQFHLVDAVHPRSVRELARKCPWIQIHNWDLSQAPEELWREHSSILGEAKAHVSCNLLSQLPLAESTTPGRDPFQACHRHMALFAAGGKPGILISDFLRHKKAADGTWISRERTIPPLSAPAHTWTWDLAPIGEVARDHSITLDVGIWTSKEIQKNRIKTV